MPKPLAVKVNTFLARQRRSKIEFISEAIRQYLIRWWETGIEGKKPKKIPKGQEWIWIKEVQASLRESMEDFKEWAISYHNELLKILFGVIISL